VLPFQKGTNQFLMPFDGEERHFSVYVPSSYNESKATPVVFGFHGTSGNGNSFMTKSKWIDKAEQEGIIIVFPTAWKYFIIHENRTTTKWNETHLIHLVNPGTKVMDDVGLVKAIFTSLIETFNINKRSVYATGFSNGGRFVNTRVVPELNSIFAAVATSSGMAREDHNVQGSLLPNYTIVGTKDGKLMERTHSSLPIEIDAWAQDSILNLLYVGMTQTLKTGTSYQQKITNNKRVYTYQFGDHKSSSPQQGFWMISIIDQMRHVYPNGTNNPYQFVAANRFWRFFEQFER
ncbi:MAG: PHB depolymerase family esterase, partial [Bacteroidota bacterium]